MRAIRRLRNDGPRIGRRNFFKKTALMGAAIAASLCGAKRAVRAGVDQPEPTASNTRYRETDHVRQYYEKAGL